MRIKRLLVLGYCTAIALSVTDSSLAQLNPPNECDEDGCPSSTSSIDAIIFGIALLIGLILRPKDTTKMFLFYISVVASIIVPGIVLQRAALAIWSDLGAGVSCLFGLIGMGFGVWAFSFFYKLGYREESVPPVQGGTKDSADELAENAKRNF